MKTPRLDVALDMRYRGQSYELTVPLDTPITPEALHGSVGAFHAAHEQRYGYAMRDEPVEVVNLRVRGVGPGAQPGLPSAPLQGEDASAARLPDKPVWFSAHAPTRTACYSRERFAPGNRFDGPALVFQFDSTIVTSPGWRGRVDEFANIWLDRN